MPAMAEGSFQARALDDRHGPCSTTAAGVLWRRPTDTWSQPTQGEAAMSGHRNGHETTPHVPGEEMTGASSVVRTLETLGVDVVFGIPGGAILPLYDPL